MAKNTSNLKTLIRDEKLPSHFSVEPDDVLLRLFLKWIWLASHIYTGKKFLYLRQDREKKVCPGNLTQEGFSYIHRKINFFKKLFVID